MFKTNKRGFTLANSAGLDIRRACTRDGGLRYFQWRSVLSLMWPRSRRYLRAREARHGILLLVHQHERVRGWQDAETGEFLNFGEVVTRLRVLAGRIAGAEPDAPQPEIATLDVSGC